MTKRHDVSIFVWVVIVGLLLTACNVGNTQQGVETPTPSTDSIKLGGTLPLTGPFADTALWIERGYRHWAEDVNTHGGLLGRQVELVIYDDEGSPEKAVQLLEKAIVQDEVDLLLGGYPGTAAAVQMPVAETHRMVYVSMGGHLHSFEQGFTYSFGAPPLMGQWWYEGFWQWVATLPPSEQPHKMAMITLNNIVGLSVREGGLDGANRLGIEIVVDELYDLPLESAEVLISQAQEADADLFVANGFFPDGVQAVRAMKKLDYNPSFFLQCAGSLVPDWKTQLQADGDYVFSGTPLHPKLPFEGIIALNAVVEGEYGISTMPAYFLYGTAWLQALQAGVEGTSSLDQEAIRDYLKSHSIVTVGGTFTFDERGLPEPYSYLTQVQPTGVELIWPPKVQTAAPIYPKPPWGE